MNPMTPNLSFEDTNLVITCLKMSASSWEILQTPDTQEAVEDARRLAYRLEEWQRIVAKPSG